MYAKNVLEKMSPKEKDSLHFSLVVTQKQVILQPRNNSKDR